MEKNVLRAIDGIALYPLISFTIFGLFFLALLAYVLVVRQEFIGRMAQLPLQTDELHAPGFGLAQEGGASC
jgi:hypothetical protein